MLYLSEKTGKTYKTVEELQTAELEFDKAAAEKAKLMEEKRARAKEVEEAYLEYQKVIEESTAKMAAAEKKWVELRNKFAEDYNGYHMTYVNNNGKKTVTVGELLDVMNKLSNW